MFASVRKWRKWRRNSEDGDTKVPRVKEFKYLESMMQESGSCESKEESAGRNGWGKLSGVICDRRLPARVKGKVVNSVVRPAISSANSIATVILPLLRPLAYP